MVHVKIVTYEESRHRDKLYNLFLEYGNWTENAVSEHYGILYEDVLGGTLEEMGPKVFPVPTTLKPPEGIILILEVDGQAAGMGRLSKLDEGVAEMNNMFVSRDHGGKGYGGLILEALEGKAVEFGYSVLRLDTGKHNIATQKLYRKAGYVERGYYSSSKHGRVARDTTEAGHIYYENKIYMEKTIV